MLPGLAPKLSFTEKLNCGYKKTLGSGFSAFPKSEFVYFLARLEVLTSRVSSRQSRLPPASVCGISPLNSPGLPSSAAPAREKGPEVASDGDRAPALCLKAAAWRRSPHSLHPYLALGVKGEPPTHQPPRTFRGGGGWVRVSTLVRALRPGRQR